MRKIISTILIISFVSYGLFLYAPQEASAAWLSGYDHRIEIEIDPSKIDADLANFPVLVHLEDAVELDFSKASSTGADIRFTSSDGETLIDFERETHNATTANYWVEVPSVSSSTAATTTLYIYYGNSEASDAASSTAPWDANFKIVAHMKDLTTSTVEDSTSNGLDGTKKGANEPIETNGIIGEGQACDGTDDYIFFPNDASYKELNGKDLTGLIWIKTTDGGAFNESIFGIYSNDFAGGPTPNQAWHLFYGDGTVKSWLRRDGSAETVDALSITTTLDDDAWHLVGFRKDGKKIEVLVDGVSEASDTLASDGNTDNNFVLGLGATYGRFLDYDVDEFTISSVARSNAWIKASYNSGNDSLVSFGEEEAAEAPPSVSTTPIYIKGNVKIGNNLIIK